MVEIEQDFSLLSRRGCLNKGGGESPLKRLNLAQEPKLKILENKFTLLDEVLILELGVNNPAWYSLLHRMHPP